MPEPSTAGRRRAAEVVSGRPSPLVVLAVLLPLLTVAALALVRPVQDPTDDRPPADAQLSRATLVCPRAVGETGTVAIASAEGARGDVTVRVPAEDTLPVGRGTARTGTDDAFAFQGEGDLAPGLVASRYGAGAAASCDAPAPELWFTGVGAAAEHASTLELVNPDGGPAVADVTVLGPDGPVDVPALRGVTVSGGKVARFDLSDVAPSRDELALHVVVSRGRLGVHVVDRVDELGRGARSQDWLAGQEAPATTSYLMGLGGKPGDRTLAVANTGDSETRVRLKVVTSESEFTPSAAQDLRIAPGSVGTLDLGRLLGSKAARGATGVRLESTQPVTASLRTLAAGDLSHAVAGTPVTSRAALVLPSGGKRLVLGGASALGVATWTALDGQGKELAQERVEIGPGTSRRIKLPAAATLLDLRLDRTAAVAVVEAGPPGLVVLPMSELVVSGQVPDVRPALR
jgi:hypothetical protein